MLTPNQVCDHEQRELLSVPEFVARFAALGYTVDRSLDCRSVARYLTGPMAGECYLSCTTSVKEADTGLSAFNYTARRDANFRKMQTLRREIAALSHGALLEV